jgi:8-oxo-dGTP diphosphatase
MKIKQVYANYDRTAPPPAEESFMYCPCCRGELVFKEIGNRPRQACEGCGYIRYKNPAPAVSVLIVKDGKVLLGKRANEPGKGKWATPSGYIEFEDDYLTTAVREAREETGLEIEIKAILNVASSFLSPKYHFFAVYLLAEAVGGALTPGDDMLEVAWFSPAEPLPELAFEEDRDVLAAFAREKLEGLPI